MFVTSFLGLEVADLHRFRPGDLPPGDERDSVDEPLLASCGAVCTTPRKVIAVTIQAHVLTKRQLATTDRRVTYRLVPRVVWQSSLPGRNAAIARA